MYLADTTVSGALALNDAAHIERSKLVSNSRASSHGRLGMDAATTRSRTFVGRVKSNGSGVPGRVAMLWIPLNRGSPYKANRSVNNQDLVLY